MAGAPHHDDGDDGELEVVPLEDGEPFPPPRPPWHWLVQWADRHRRLLLLLSLAPALLATAHAVVAVRGVRALERHTQAAVLLRAEYDEYVTGLRGSRTSRGYRLLGVPSEADRVARVTADYSARLSELAERVQDVVVIDPGLRRLRRTTLTLMREEAEEARVEPDEPGAWFPPFRVRMVAQEVEDRLDRWRRTPGSPPRVRPLASVAALRKPTPLLDERTGVQLFTVAQSGVIRIDVDAGTVMPVGDDRDTLGPWALGDGFLGVVDFGEGIVRPLHRAAATVRIPGDYDEVLPDAADGNRLWFVTRPNDPGDPGPTRAHAFDRAGVKRDEVVLDEARELSAVSSRWLVLQDVSGDGTSMEVVDRQRGAALPTRTGATFFALRGDTLLWGHRDRLLVRALPTGADRTVAPPRAGMRPATAVLSNDRRRLAVVWARFDGDRLHESALVVYDATELQAIGEVAWQRTRPVFPRAEWSARGDWLFIVEASDGGTTRLLAWREGLAQPKPLLIEGEFYGLSAQ
ncbi:MAG: hypothetical protein M3394_08180 [Actinomycetota bacterium]|nr:hypothetical protein [Actinomycetota bacterium]